MSERPTYFTDTTQNFILSFLCSISKKDYKRKCPTELQMDQATVRCLPRGAQWMIVKDRILFHSSETQYCNTLCRTLCPVKNTTVAVKCALAFKPFFKKNTLFVLVLSYSNVYIWELISRILIKSKLFVLLLDQTVWRNYVVLTMKIIIYCSPVNS